MTSTRQLVDALARYLDSTGIARYQPTGAYPSGALPAIFDGLFPAAPDAALALTVYDVQYGRGDIGNEDVYIQFRWRTAGKDPRITNDVADRATELLHDAERLLLPGGVRILLCRRKIRGITTPDSNGRYERADSFMFTLNPGGTS
ncbi:phage tail terminator protein [Nocardia salmonicida]|uniref:phage tail terminator protein n=1 Tax=Nocardia salmonicida TaxID=53431 RepID=UPI00363B4FE0